MDITRRSFLKLAGGTLATTAVAGSSLFTMTGCGSSSDKVILGYYSGVCEAPIYIGFEKGYFKEEGLDAELIKITDKPATLIANDKLDCYELTPDTFMAMKEGAEYCITDSLHIGCVKGVARPELNIKSYRDLEGKTIGGKPSSIAAIQISSLMTQAGLDPKKVTWRTYDSKPMYERALWNKEIDGFCAYDPWCDIAEINGAKKFFNNGADEGLKDYLCCFVGMSTRTLKRNPEIGVKLSRAFKKACQFLAEHPEEAAQIILDKGYVPVDTDSGFTKEIAVAEIKEYKWIAGDKNLVEKSFEKIWMDIYYAGQLKDVPEGMTPQDYINGTLAKQMVQFQG